MASVRTMDILHDRSIKLHALFGRQRPGQSIIQALNAILTMTNDILSRRTIATMYDFSDRLVHWMKIPFHATAGFAFRIWTMITAAARYICRLPNQVLKYLEQAVRDVARAMIGAVASFARKLLKLLATVILLVITVPLCRWAYLRYKARRLEEQRQRELEQERLNREIFERQLEQRRLRNEQEKARREEERKQQRAQSEERARRAEARREQETRHQKAENHAKARKQEEEQRKEDAKEYKIWREKCNVFFKRTLQELSTAEFPEPNHWICDKPACKQPRYLEACPHSLRRLLEATSEWRETLKLEQKRWHPNFSACAKFHSGEPQVQRFKDKALELSQELQGMVDAEKGK